VRAPQDYRRRKECEDSMVKFRVTRIVEFAHDIEADTQEEALAAFDPGQAKVRVIRETAKVPRMPAGSAITDRELRVGRRFQARRKGRTYTALVMGDGQIEVADEEGHNLGSFKGLHAAAMAITEGSSVNAWSLFKDVPAEGTETETTPEPVTEGTPPPPARRKAPPKAAKRRTKKS